MYARCVRLYATVYLGLESMLCVRRRLLTCRQMSAPLPRQAIAEWCIFLGSQLAADDGEISYWYCYTRSWLSTEPLYT